MLPEKAPTTEQPEVRSPLVRLMGIRHHGPGSARAVLACLEESAPDIVLIEGPAEADVIAPLAIDPEMDPPVAMLGHVLDHPERAAFYPFASFSPEWVALTWARRRDIPVRFIDLPLKHALAPDLTERPKGRRPRPIDPLAELASAAGYDDPERWWEDVVEHRSGDGGAHGSAMSAFDAIADAMTILRAGHDSDVARSDAEEERREAQMRVGIRKALADGHQRIDVVCGAWHVPALRELGDSKAAKADVATLRGLPKVKAAITWVPWTHRRLATATGYGAGVTAPGWYHHLFAHAGPDVIARWFTEAARVLRAADYATSAADVVEATRLASSLAVLRGRPLAGLAEVDDSARAVLGDGTDTPMRLISSALVVGAQIGTVPVSTPMVPLARDLLAEQRRLRLKPEAPVRTLELDLRKRNDLDRSRLLHRLTAIGVPWGQETEGRRSAGTFRETWQLRWEPELEVRLIEAAALGTTVRAAASAAVAGTAGATESLAELTGLLERSLLAGLDDTIGGLVTILAERSALAHDALRLMDALAPLARTIRYGDVRGTDASALVAVVRSMVGRVAAGLVAASTGLDSDGAADMATRLHESQAALALLAVDEHVATFRRGVSALVERDGVHGLLQGVATRMLADADLLQPDVVERRVSRALSHGTPPLEAAAFVEGFLGASGTVLVHDPLLLRVLDQWISSLPADAFVDALPLLRRTFGGFDAAERRSIGERIRTGEAPGTQRGETDLDPERVAAALETMAQLLGLEGASVR